MYIEFRWILVGMISIIPILTFISVQQYRNCSINQENNVIATNTFKKWKIEQSDNLPVSAEHSKGKILFMTASYTLKQYEYLWKVIEGYRDICEAGWEVDIAIQASNGLNSTSLLGWQLSQSAYCQRLQRYINISFQTYGDIGFGLNSQHRHLIKSRLQDYDYFIYSEEDMLFTPHHLNAFLLEEKKLKEIFPTSWLNYTVGHLRYEVHSPSLSQVSWEYMPDKIHVIKLDESLVRSYIAQHSLSEEESSNLGYYVATNNLNQAFYIIGREQMTYLEERCDFLSKPGKNLFMQQLRKALNKDWKYLSVGVSEWSSSFQQILQCGLIRLVPIHQFQSFRLHHLTNIGHKRRLQKELLSSKDWADIIAEKRKQPLSVQTVYQDIIYSQYNLHLLDYAAIEGKIKFVRWN